MNRIPGLIPGLRCPRCARVGRVGNIREETDIVFGKELKCVQCERIYKEPEKQEVNDGS